LSQEAEVRGTGYLISIGSVILLGLVAWPRPDEPSWHLPALLAGMALSMLGMGLRWLASRKQLGESHRTEEAVGLRQPAE
jgi:hypothetical protein